MRWAAGRVWQASGASRTASLQPRLAGRAAQPLSCLTSRRPPAASPPRPQAILNGILLTYKPDVTRALIAFARHPGESDAVVAQRWRDVAVSRGVVPGRGGVGSGVSRSTFASHRACITPPLRPPRLQAATRVTREQAEALLPLYRDLCAKEASLAANSRVSMGTLAQIQEALSQQLLALDESLGASALQYLKLFEAAGQLSHQPDTALMYLIQFYGAAGVVEWRGRLCGRVCLRGCLVIQQPTPLPCPRRLQASACRRCKRRG